MRRWLVAGWLALVLAGCGQDLSGCPYVGEWQATTGDAGGVRVDLEDIDSHFALQLAASGEASLEVGERVYEGSWSPVKYEGSADIDHGLTLSTEEGDWMFAPGEDDTLSTVLDGVTLVFAQVEADQP